MTSLLLSIICYRESKGILPDLNPSVNVISTYDAQINSALALGARLVGRSLNKSRMRSYLTEVKALVPSYDR